MSDLGLGDLIAARLGSGPAHSMVGGVKVYVSPDTPKLQLSERVKEVLTPAQIADHNAWLLQYFGTTNLLADGQYIQSDLFGFVTMNPRTHEQFKKSVKS